MMDPEPSESSSLVRLELRDFLAASRLTLLDLEFTCWEDSRESGWADETRPAEIIEIGVAAFACHRNEVVGTYRSYVRPRMNPRLSEYCRGLLHISQREIDGAPSLADAVSRLRVWEAAMRFEDAPTCAWGHLDRVFLRDDAQRVGCDDPFRGRPHVDLATLARSKLGLPGEDPLDRETLRARAALAPCPDRHAALADALDLKQFCEWLKTQVGDRRARQARRTNSGRIAP